MQMSVLCYIVLMTCWHFVFVPNYLGSLKLGMLNCSVCVTEKDLLLTNGFTFDDCKI